MSALHALLNRPCSTCRAAPDERPWLSWHVAGAFISECPDCFEARFGVADIGQYEPHTLTFASAPKPVRIKATRRKKSVSSQQMELGI